MIGKISSGKSFSGLFKYLEKSGHEYIYDTNLNFSSQTAKEMKETAKNRDIEKSCYHVSLTLKNEKIDSATWSEIASEYLRKMNVDTRKHEYAVIRHTDTEHDHIHIVLNRVAKDFTVWSTSNDRYISMKALREIREKHNIAEPESVRTATHKDIETTKDRAMKARNEKTQKQEIAERLKSMMTQPGCQVLSIQTFQKICESLDIEMTLSQHAKNGRIQGFKFKMKDEKYVFNGKQVGFCFNAVRTRFFDINDAGYIISKENTLEREKMASTTKSDDTIQHTSEREKTTLGATRYVREYETLKNTKNATEREKMASTTKSDDTTQHTSSEHEKTVRMTAHELIALREKSSERLLRKKMEEINMKKNANDVKKEIMRRQHNAMTADAYHLQAVDRKPRAGTGISKNITGGEPADILTIESNIESLTSYNVSNCDIYIRPASATYIYFLLDDLNAKKLEKVMSELKPCLVIESSKDNFQAILKVKYSAENEKEKTEVGKRVIHELSEKYDSDRGVTGANWTSRLAGFYNKKQNRNNENIRIIHAQDICDTNTDVILKKHILEYQKEQEEKEKNEWIDAIEKKKKDSEKALSLQELKDIHAKYLVNGTFKKYKSMQTAIEKSIKIAETGKELNTSALDFEMCCLYIREKMSVAKKFGMKLKQSDIKADTAQMLSLSPSARFFGVYGGEQYIRVTIENAIQNVISEINKSDNKAEEERGITVKFER